MTEPAPPREELPEAVVEERSRFSIVWVVPIVAALVGAFLAWKAISEQGPTVHIRFESAAGLEAGKTEVKYKQVQIGIVEAIELSEDLRSVEVTASLVAGSERFLREDTRFWVVRAQVSAGQITGLSTVLSGSYIAVDPATEGRERRRFVGLEVAPLVTTDEPGTLFTLRSDRLGSLDRGSPVLFKSMQVGRVVGYELDEEGERMTIGVFVEAPHDARVSTATRFWNASGIDVSVGTEGVRIDTPSVLAMILGGVSFATPVDAPDAGPADENTLFWLYPDEESTVRRTYGLRSRYLLYFDQSVAGLSPGAPVELHGIRIGEVEDVHLEVDTSSGDIRIPVRIMLEPERLSSEATQESARLGMERLVEQGLRARLRTGNLLTGKLLVDFAIDEHAEPASIDDTGIFPVLPTAEGSFEQITNSVARIAQRLEGVRFDEVGAQVQELLASLDEAIGEIGGLTRTVNDELAPSLVGTLEELDRTLRSATALVDPDSPRARDLDRMLLDLSDAARSLRLFIDELERRPESLLRGRRSPE